MVSVKMGKFEISEKVKIMQEVETNPNVPRIEVAPSSLSCIMKNKDSIIIAQLESGGGACKCMDKAPPHNS
jgi:hypothetical protein